MNLSVKEICREINGNWYGKSNVIVNSSSSIEKTTNNSICFLENVKFEKKIYSNDFKASVIIIQYNLLGKLSFSLEEILKKSTELKTIILVKNNAKESFTVLLNLFDKRSINIGIEKTSFISKNAKIGKKNYIGAFSYIGNESETAELVQIFPNCYIGNNVKIGNNTIIYSGVKIYDNTVIKSNCIIHSGCVIGADGFGFIKKDLKNIKIPHLGNVIIEENVEIGANTCIDRGKTHSDSTLIKREVKIDNLVQIGHNVEIGENTMIAGCTGIAGSVKIGKNCLIGGKVAIADHVIIADEIRIAGNSGVTKSFLKKGVVIQGPIAFEKNKFQKSYIHFKNISNKK
ncbi:MAG: UDP-3-O-(3-hydroxymyristoyl)glucosamine N-acyltransferase [Bacteroidota bacterium]|nr:UDP-3-O-(3-hydroxymyristoyl)glucosamine N-acyltransferase [Bacteroidota bacterium]